ncbi:hypothetical protein TRV_01690, partial [Trichophyton verrucosum HKI 0517]
GGRGRGGERERGREEERKREEEKGGGRLAFFLFLRGGKLKKTRARQARETTNGRRTSLISLLLQAGWETNEREEERREREREREGEEGEGREIKELSLLGDEKKKKKKKKRRERRRRGRRRDEEDAAKRAMDGGAGFAQRAEGATDWTRGDKGRQGDLLPLAYTLTMQALLFFLKAEGEAAKRQTPRGWWWQAEKDDRDRKLKKKKEMMIEQTEGAGFAGLPACIYVFLLAVSPFFPPDEYNV